MHLLRSWRFGISYPKISPQNQPNIRIGYKSKNIFRSTISPSMKLILNFLFNKIFYWLTHWLSDLSTDALRQASFYPQMCLFCQLQQLQCLHHSSPKAHLLLCSQSLPPLMLKWWFSGKRIMASVQDLGKLQCKKGHFLCYSLFGMLAKHSKSWKWNEV